MKNIAITILISLLITSFIISKKHYHKLEKINQEDKKNSFRYFYYEGRYQAFKEMNDTTSNVQPSTFDDALDNYYKDYFN